MKIRADELQHFGVTRERYDDFMDAVAEMKRAGEPGPLKCLWICEHLGVCPHVLFDMVDAGVFPMPIADQ